MIAVLIRQCSESGRLISELELGRQFIEEHGLPFADRDAADIPSTLAMALEHYDDLHELPSDDGAPVLLFLTRNDPDIRLDALAKNG